MATIQCPRCSHMLTLPSAPSAGGWKCPQCQQVLADSSGSAPAASSVNSKASDTFDPYYNWLGIPPRDQPPHHYRLLGLELFEANRDVIDNAANRQSAHLRTCSLGARATFAQELLNQVAAARVCLLTETRKTEYDATLRRQVLPTAEHKSPVAYPSGNIGFEQTPPASATTSSTTAPPIKFVGSAKPNAGRRPSHRPNAILQAAKIIIGGVVGLAIGYLLLLVFFPTALEQNRSGRIKKNASTVRQSVSESESPSTRRPTSKPIQERSSTSRQTSPRSEDGSSRNRQRDLSRHSDLLSPQVESGSPNSPSIPSPKELGVTHPFSVLPTTPPPSDQLESTPVSDDSSSTSPQVEAVPGSSIPSTTVVDSGDPKLPKGDLRDDFPTRVKLPSTEETTWVTLLSLSEPVTRVELVAACEMTSAAPVISIIAAPDTLTSSWDFECEMPSDDRSPKVPAKLAQLQFDSKSGDIQFRWLSTNPAGAAALANSWLKLETGSKVGYVSLRTPMPHPAIKIDLEKERVIVPLNIDSIPATDQLYLDLTSLTGLPSTAIFRNGMGYAKLDREVIIEFSDMPGAQIGVKFANVPQAPLGLIIEPRFKDGPSREYDLTFAQLEKTQRGAAEAIQEAKGKISGLSSNLAAAQSALSSAQGRSPRNAAEAQQKAVDVNRFAKITQDANRRLVAMRKQEADAQSRLNNVPKVLAFMWSLQGKEIPFRVIVKSSAAELALAQGMIGAGDK